MKNKCAKLVFMLALIIGIFTISVCAEEDNTDAKKYHFYDINQNQYDLFLNNPGDVSWLSEVNLQERTVGQTCISDLYLYSEEVVDALKDDVLVNAYIRSRYSDLEVYEKKIIRPDIHLVHYFNIGDFLWLSTNHGVKIIEFKRPVQWRGMITTIGGSEWERQGDLWFGGDSFDEGYDVIYYDNPEEYIEKYKSRTPEVYVNGKEVENTYYLEYRNERPLMALRFYMEQCGIDVEWTEEYSGMTKYSNDVLALYTLVDMNESSADVTLMRKEIYDAFDIHKKTYDDISVAYQFPPLTEEIFPNLWLPSGRGRQLMPRDCISRITELFGKKVEVKPNGDKIYIEITDTEPVPVLKGSLMVLMKNGTTVALPDC